MRKKYSNLNILLVGAAGKFGMFYLESLIENLNIPAQNIVAVDVDAKRLNEAKKKFLGITVFADLKGAFADAILNETTFDCALITASTPSHHTIILECMKHGIKCIFVEKPLAINLKAAEEIKKKIKDEKIFVAFIGNFSDTQKHVSEFMRKENLYLCEAFAIWSKDRSGDSRPTPGSLDDESVHGLMAIYNYASINQEIKSMKIQARLSWFDFVNKIAQKKARDIDSSMPKHPVSTTFVMQEYLTDKGVALVGMRCTFLGPRKQRFIHLTLCDVNMRNPKYLVEINSSELENVLRVKKVADNESETEIYRYKSNKVVAELEAFLNFVSDDMIDPRLTDFKTAMLSLKITEAARKSDGKKGKLMKVL